MFSAEIKPKAPKAGEVVIGIHDQLMTAHYCAWTGSKFTTSGGEEVDITHWARRPEQQQKDIFDEV